MSRGERGVVERPDGLHEVSAAPAGESGPDRETPMLTVVVTVVDGGETLRRCLGALLAQESAPPLEIIVPFDGSLAEVPALAAGYPGVRALPMGPCATARPPGTPAGRHELFDRRRAAGLAAAQGAYVALLEDRCLPRPDWTRTMVTLAAGGVGALGGAVASAARDRRSWAEYFCDYGRYQPPFAAGERAYVTDVNVCYPRAVLESTRELWWPRYQETTLHWALTRAGKSLRLDPRPVVDHVRAGRPLGSMLRERFEWGRLYATTRVRAATPWRRAMLAGLAPLLPAVLYGRLAREQLRKRSTPRQFLGATPHMLLLLAAWTAGEVAGYVTGRE